MDRRDPTARNGETQVRKNRREGACSIGYGMRGFHESTIQAPLEKDTTAAAPLGTIWLTSELLSAEPLFANLLVGAVLSQLKDGGRYLFS